MKQILEKYIPEHAVDLVFDMIVTNNVHLKIVNERVTRHGDYRKASNGKHEITVNATLNKYKFLMTLIHEIAHLVAFEKFGKLIKPHGTEWKYTFQRLMLPFLRPEIFPSQLLGLLALHFKNPTASSDTDARLTLAMKKYDEQTDLNYIFEIPTGSLFRIKGGRIFQKQEKKIKRYVCLEVKTGKKFLFNPNAEVEIIPQKL